MKAEEILATYCTGSMFILERQDVVVGILQDNGVKKKDAEKAYSIFKQKLVKYTYMEKSMITILLIEEEQ